VGRKKSEQLYEFKEIQFGSLLIFFTDNHKELLEALTEHADILSVREIETFVVPKETQIAVLTTEKMKVLGIQIYKEKDSSKH
jgi:hypothetical protein